MLYIIIPQSHFTFTHTDNNACVHTESTPCSLHCLKDPPMGYTLT